MAKTADFGVVLTTSGEDRASDQASDAMPWAIKLTYTVLGALLVGYLALALFHPHGGWWEFVNQWPYDVFEIVAAVLCTFRVLKGGAPWRASLALGGALLVWGGGDLAWDIETRMGGTPASPSVADAFYLAFYPLAFIALMLLMRSDVKRISLGNWLDGLIVGIAAAAMTAAFFFDTILRSLGGSAASLATNLAYPIGDLLLLALIAAAISMLPTWRNPRWLLLAFGCTLNALGDTIFLFQSATGSYQESSIINVSWPAALFVMSLAIWAPSAPSRQSAVEHRRFVLPIVASFSGLAILLRASVGDVSRLAVVLAGSLLFVAIVRSLLWFGELRSAMESRRKEAMTDDLTGLGNRRYLMTVFNEFFAAGAKRNAHRLGLLLIDLNHFKEINDAFGHPTGDEILKMLGPRLKNILRESDVLTRIGGDEFGIVLRDADVGYATAIAERISSQLETPFLLDVAGLHVSASIGIAVTPDHAKDSTELLRCADVAMYRAKLAHRPFEIYESADDEGISRISLIEQLRDAITGRSLRLHYQPLYEIETGEARGVEALLRWPHPELGLVPPDEFIPLAEEAGLMKPLTEFVLDTALSQCARWHAEGLGVSVAVNLSTTNLLDVDLPVRIRFLLSRYRLDPRFLTLEITESTLMADRARALKVVQQLHDMGLTVSIDDFGTGFSSLAYLSDLDVGELKIDRTLIERLVSGDEKHQEIVRAAVNLGHSMNLRVVAEGVESVALFEQVRLLGCDAAQGFGLFRPVDADQIDLSPLVAGLTKIRRLDFA
jgi:diguanylate cyclase (GGDEF)-like protein